MRTPVLEARGLSVLGSLLRYGKRERSMVGSLRHDNPLSPILDFYL